MAGKLYLVGTPIGNLGDLSPRARRTLEEADFIAAEDTRVTLKLLNHFGISKPLVSYYQHNKERSGERIVERILSGENCALVTDAGMPIVSDPGEDLAVACAAAGIEITAVRWRSPRCRREDFASRAFCPHRKRAGRNTSSLSGTRNAR